MSSLNFARRSLYKFNLRSLCKNNILNVKSLKGCYRSDPTYIDQIGADPDFYYYDGVS